MKGGNLKKSFMVLAVLSSLGLSYMMVACSKGPSPTAQCLFITQQIDAVGKGTLDDHRRTQVINLCIGLSAEDRNCLQEALQLAKDGVDDAHATKHQLECAIKALDFIQAMSRLPD